MVCRKFAFSAVGMVLSTNLLETLCEKNITQTMPIRGVKAPMRSPGLPGLFVSLKHFYALIPRLVKLLAVPFGCYGLQNIPTMVCVFPFPIPEFFL